MPHRFQEGRDAAHLRLEYLRRRSHAVETQDSHLDFCWWFLKSRLVYGMEEIEDRCNVLQWAKQCYLSCL